jgi:hypothetical protein
MEECGGQKVTRGIHAYRSGQAINYTTLECKLLLIITPNKISTKKYECAEGALLSRPTIVLHFRPSRRTLSSWRKMWGVWLVFVARKHHVNLYK